MLPSLSPVENDSLRIGPSLTDNITNGERSLINQWLNFVVDPSPADHPKLRLYTINELQSFVNYLLSNVDLDMYSRWWLRNWRVLNPFQLAILEWGFSMYHYYPIKVTSTYRPSGTHRFGAVDFAPNLDVKDYAHNRLVDPRLYARKPVLINLLKVVQDFPDLTVLVEDNHFHVHANSNPGLPSGFPIGGVVLQVRPRPGYARSKLDMFSDEFFIQQGPWLRVTGANVLNLPNFSRRF